MIVNLKQGLTDYIVIVSHKDEGIKVYIAVKAYAETAGKCQSGEVRKGREKDIPNTAVIPRVLEKRATGSRGTKQGGRCVSDGPERRLRE